MGGTVAKPLPVKGPSSEESVLQHSPSLDLALFFDDKFVPDFPMFGLVAIILELSHLTANVDQGVQQW